MSTRIHDTYARGDIRVFFQHVGVPTSDDPDPIEHPTMCVGRRNAPSGSRRAWLIPLPELYRYVERDGRPTGELIMRAPDIAEFIGLTALSTFGVIESICDGADELRKMPPKPSDPKKMERLAERDGLVLRVGDQTVVDAR